MKQIRERRFICDYLNRCWSKLDFCFSQISSEKFSEALNFLLEQLSIYANFDLTGDTLEDTNKVLEIANFLVVTGLVPGQERLEREEEF